MSVTVAPIRPPRRLARLAAVVLAVAAVAGCSSSSAVRGGATTTDGSRRTTSSNPSPAPSSTGVAPATPPCTVDAATAVLPSGARAIGILCIDGWASGPDRAGAADGAFLLQAVGSTWQPLAPDRIAQACAADNPLHIPSDVLGQSPCAVG